MQDYDLVEHRHRFSTWASARAAQRKWKSASVGVLRDALDACGVVAFVKGSDFVDLDNARFINLHRTWCRSLIQFLIARGLVDVTFGRAAKLIAVYIKSMVVISDTQKSSLSFVAHPPIDRILLANMCKSSVVESVHKKEWRRISWTQLDEAQYYRLIEQLRSTLHHNDPFWTLERYWTVTNDPED